MLYCAWQGQKVITMSGRFDLDTFCRLVEQHKPQRAHLVPPILVGLAKSPCVDHYDLTSLKMINSAAAPLSSDIEEAVKKRLDCDVKQGWGMSELSPLGTLNSDFNAKQGSVGPLVPSTYGKIVDEAGNSLPANEDGELLIKVCFTIIYRIVHRLYGIFRSNKRCILFSLGTASHARISG
jgi:acyl-CoA synthetase (AMP-forming)/AMP-acid ligase II